jgi:HEAT repeat protein
VLDENDLIREETVVALGAIADPRAVPKLLNLLGSFSEKVRLASAEALQDIGVPAAPALLVAAKSPNPVVRIGAARALGGIQDPEGRARAMTVALLNDPDAGVRIAAADALGQQPNPSTVPALIAKFEDPDGRVGDEAAAAVAGVGKPAVPALISALRGGPGSSKVYYASSALRAIGRDAVPGLVTALRASDPVVARWSARILGDLGDTQALSELQSAAQSSPSPEVRWAAARSAERLGGATPESAS